MGFTPFTNTTPLNAEALNTRLAQIAALGGVSSMVGCHVYPSSTASIASSSETLINLTAEHWASAGMHTTLTTAFTGTVAFSSGSTAVVGTGTLFTTEMVPGTCFRAGSYINVVLSIQDDTHLTTAHAWTVASGGSVTIYRAPNAVVIPTPGRYMIIAQLSISTGTTGIREIRLKKNPASSQLLYHQQPSIGSGQFYMQAIGFFNFTLYEYITMSIYHTQGTSLTMTGSNLLTSTGLIVQRLGDS